MRFLFKFCLVLLALKVSQATASPVKEWMPKTEDYTSMWWRDGFPSITPGAKWIRCMRTGNYALAMNTETLEIPHLGGVEQGVPYATSNWLGTDWTGLPGAKLELSITANGKTYHSTKAGKWTRQEGPRLIVSGKFQQRADITGLEFKAEDGSTLNAEARIETIAWPDKLGWVFTANPGKQKIQAGEASFGRIHGGYGFDGSNHLKIAHRPELDPENFTLEFWAFIPHNYQSHETVPPWVVCKNHHEHFDGNYGIMIINRQPQARLNIGGGREGSYTAVSKGRNSLKFGAWNHLAMSYDSQTLRLFVNGQVAGETAIGKKRKPGKFPLVFGRRLARDNLYCFRGVLDEIRLYDRPLTLQEIRSRFGSPEVAKPNLKPVAEWLFSKDRQAASKINREKWDDVRLQIDLSSSEASKPSLQSITESKGDSQATLWMDPVAWKKTTAAPDAQVMANEVSTGKACPVHLDQKIGAFRVNLNKMAPIAPKGEGFTPNDVLERYKLTLSNPSGQEVAVPLVFEKTIGGIVHRYGFPITGVSALLRDKEGNPTGIPIQLSKNWHNNPQGGSYASQWFHGVSQVRLPPGKTAELELVIAYGHWGGIPAVTHSQLSLIGWGGNQLWEQAAYGAWGESICFDSEQAQAGASITDVRPLMVKSMGNQEKWGWTVNVGGGDFLRLFDKSGKRIPHSSMKSSYHRQGPCLTEVSHSGKIGNSIRHWRTIHLARNNDITRAIYRFRMEVSESTEFSRLVLFQVGSDTYNYSAERKFAVGNETGLLREWETNPGGNTYQTTPEEWKGRTLWASLHEAARDPGQPKGAWANRGLIIRDWKARFGGKSARPFYAERGLERHNKKSSTFDILPPPQVRRLEPGDYVEAVIEHVIIPKSAEDYYGPNQALSEALAKHGNTWRMVSREALNEPIIQMQKGVLLYKNPGFWIQAENGTAKFELSGGTSYIPIVFKGLAAHNSSELLINGQPLDQQVHGKDFWQSDFNPETQTWSHVFNIPPSEDSQTVELRPN